MKPPCDDRISLTGFYVSFLDCLSIPSKATLKAIKRTFSKFIFVKSRSRIALRSRVFSSINLVPCVNTYKYPILDNVLFVVLPCYLHLYVLDCLIHIFKLVAKMLNWISAEKESKIRSFKERQNEERHKKLEEIKAQAMAAQRFKEEKEQERRRRLEEMRLKDDTRRHQVEERKRAINDAERDRLESILRRNQEREARIEARRKNERSSIVFAFGSSTPRMLDPTDITVSFWGHRRATSTQNITSTTSSGSSLTRRQSERDLDTGSKKRATSAGGLERAGESTYNIPFCLKGELHYVC